MAVRLDYLSQQDQGQGRRVVGIIAQNYYAAVGKAAPEILVWFSLFFLSSGVVLCESAQWEKTNRYKEKKKRCLSRGLPNLNILLRGRCAGPGRKKCVSVGSLFLMVRRDGDHHSWCVNGVPWKSDLIRCKVRERVSETGRLGCRCGNKTEQYGAHNREQPHVAAWWIVETCIAMGNVFTFIDIIND